MRHNITIGEISDKVASLAWKRIAKYAAILYVAQALAGAGVGFYLGVMYPEKVMEVWDAVGE